MIRMVSIEGNKSAFTEWDKCYPALNHAQNSYRAEPPLGQKSDSNKIIFAQGLCNFPRKAGVFGYKQDVNIINREVARCNQPPMLQDFFVF